MTDETLREVFILVYTGQSYISAVLFWYMWRLTHSDRVENDPPEDRKEARLQRAVAWRNEIVAGVLALAFTLYSSVGTISTIRLFGFMALPWIEGLITTPLLVVGNFLEMLIAVALVEARRSMNRG